MLSYPILNQQNLFHSTNTQTPLAQFNMDLSAMLKHTYLKIYCTTAPPSEKYPKSEKKNSSFTYFGLHYNKKYTV
jgi:hypothetical protein